MTYVARTVVQSSYPHMHKHWEQYTVLHADMVGYTQLEIGMFIRYQELGIYIELEL